jgi:hypothetical protein
LSIEWDIYRLNWARFKCTLFKHMPVTIMWEHLMVRCCARCGREL